MYMEGFKFTLDEDQPCLNLFFHDWTLDTRAKFYFAVIGCFGLAIFVEGLSAFRYRIVRSVKQAHRRQGEQQQSSTQALRLVVALCHGMQGLVGYLLMLAVMTFSVELFLSVVLGLAVGYAVFFQYEEALGRVHVTTNPCCSFLEGEARETQTQEEEEQEVQPLSNTTDVVPEATEAAADNGTTEELLSASETA